MLSIRNSVNIRVRDRFCLVLGKVLGLGFESETQLLFEVGIGTAFGLAIETRLGSGLDTGFE